ARQQADAPGARALRAVPARGAAAPGPRERRRGARAHRLAGVPARAPPARRAPTAARAALRARRRDDLCRRHHAHCLVPPEPAEHVYRQAHATDAAPDLRDRPSPPDALAPAGTRVASGRCLDTVRMSPPSRYSSPWTTTDVLPPRTPARSAGLPSSTISTR